MSTQAPAGGRFSALLLEGLDHYRKGRMLEAVRAWEEAYLLEPTNLRAREFLRSALERIHAHMGPGAKPAEAGAPQTAAAQPSAPHPWLPQPEAPAPAGQTQTFAAPPIPRPPPPPIETPAFMKPLQPVAPPPSFTPPVPTPSVSAPVKAPPITLPARPAPSYTPPADDPWAYTPPSETQTFAAPPPQPAQTQTFAMPAKPPIEGVDSPTIEAKTALYQKKLPPVQPPPANNPWDDGPSVAIPQPEDAGASGEWPVNKDPLPMEAVADDETEVWMRGARELVGLNDFSGALELLGKILARKPGDKDAQQLHDLCEQNLTQMFESKIGHMEGRPLIAIKPDEIIWLNLDPRAGFVLAQIDGEVSFEDLYAICGLKRLDTARILCELLEQGVVKVQGQERAVAKRAMHRG